MALRYLEGARAAVDQQNARLWNAYEAEQRAARGLRAGDSLDRRDGVVLPLAQAVTNGTNGYSLPLVSEDGLIAAVPLDDWALAQQGRGGVDVRGHKDEADLDERLSDRIRPRLAQPDEGSRLGGLRPLR